MTGGLLDVTLAYMGVILIEVASVIATPVSVVLINMIPVYKAWVGVSLVHIALMGVSQSSVVCVEVFSVHVTVVGVLLSHVTLMGMAPVSVTFVWVTLEHVILGKTDVHVKVTLVQVITCGHFLSKIWREHCALVLAYTIYEINDEYCYPI